MRDELNAPTALVTLKTKDRIQQILFACRIRKYNKRFKSSERALLITEASVYKLDGKNFKPMKNKTPLVEVDSSNSLAFNEIYRIYILCYSMQITALSVSTEDDHLLVIHLRSNNDLVVSLQPDDRTGGSRVGEAVGILLQQCQKYNILNIH